MAGQDIEMNAFKLLADAAYLYGEATDGSQGKLSKSIITEILGAFSYKGLYIEDKSPQVGHYKMNGYKINERVITGVSIIIGGDMVYIQLAFDNAMAFFRRCIGDTWSNWRSINIT